MHPSHLSRKRKLFHQNNSSGIYNIAIPVVCFILPINWTKDIFYLRLVTPGGGALLSIAKRKKETKGKRKLFKALLKVIKGCYSFSYSRWSRIHQYFFTDNHGGQQYFPVFHGPTTLKSISPALLFA